MDQTTAQTQEQEVTQNQQQPEQPAGQQPAPAAQQQHEPETPHDGEYELRLPADLPAHELPDDYEAHVAGFAQVAEEAGIQPRIAQRLLDAMVDASLDMRYEGQLVYEDAEAYMRTRWGQDYDRKMALVSRAVDKLGGDRLRGWLDTSGWGNHPGVVEALARFGEGQLSLTKSEAEKKLDAIMRDPKHPYWNKTLGQQERKRLTAEVRLLNAIIHEDDEPEPSAPAPISPRTFEEHRAQERANPRAQAKAELQAMLGDKHGPLMDRNHRDHDAAVRRYTELLAKL